MDPNQDNSNMIDRSSPTPAREQDDKPKPDIRVLKLIMSHCFADESGHLCESLMDNILHIYSKLVDERDTAQIEHLDDPDYECLIRIAKMEPMKGLMRFEVWLLLDFLNSKGYFEGEFNLNVLFKLLRELKAAYRFLCPEDHNALKQSLRKDREGSFDSISADTFALFSLAHIEVAKYCIKKKFAPITNIGSFLQRLRMASKSIGTFGDKIPKRCLITLLTYLEKYLEDRVLPTSTRSYTFNYPDEIEEFYILNANMFQFWLTRERRDVVPISIIFDDPAECWRISSDRLILELSPAYRTRDDLPQGKGRHSTRQRVLSKEYDAEQLQSNLTMVVLAARQLKNASLLRGLKTLVESGELVCDNPALDAIIFNIDGNYEKTYDLLREQDNLTSQQRVEFLNSCFHLGLLEDHAPEILKLNLDNPYGLFLDSLEVEGRQSLSMSDLKQWLKTWAPASAKPTPKPTSLYSVTDNLNVIVPACLNLAAQSQVQEERKSFLDLGRSLLKQDLIAQLLFSPASTNSYAKMHYLTSDLIESNVTHLDELVNLHANNHELNHILQRNLSQTKLIDKLIPDHQKAIELVELRAAKYHRYSKNYRHARSLLEQLRERTNSAEIKVKASLLLIEEESDEVSKRSHLHELAKVLNDSKPPLDLKLKLTAKILHSLLSTSSSTDQDETCLMRVLIDSEQRSDCKTSSNSIPIEPTYDRWLEVLTSTSLSSHAKVLLAIADRSLRSLTESNGEADHEQKLEISFRLDLKLLFVLTKCNKPKFKPHALECAGRILQHIVSKSLSSSQQLLNTVEVDDFINATLPIWKILKSNLISIAQYKTDLEPSWYKFVVLVIERILRDNPESFVYPVIVNRLDLESELSDLGHAQKMVGVSPDLRKVKNSARDPKSRHEELARRIEQTKHALTFWSSLKQTICQIDETNDKWLSVMSKTEEFIREIRRISFLKGEYLKNLTVQIPRRLQSFLDYFGKIWESSMGTIMSKQRMEESEKKLDTTCKEALYHLSNLMSHSCSQATDTNVTKYDAWFKETFDKQLKELEYRLNLLVGKKPLILDELDKLIKSIVELMALIRQSLMRYNHNNRQKLYMELISPKLSRFETSLIPMPEHYAQSSLASKSQPNLTIHKVFQTVDLISSKTSPKKLTFVGSDGVSRSYLLKTHDDLRLDQLIMSTFSSINDLFKGDPETREQFRLRRYAITPVSSRSGLIQWIEAPSLASKYREWLNSSKGGKLIDKIFASTCEFVCGEERLTSLSTDHTNCRTRDRPFLTACDIFYQLLWARTRPSGNPLTQTRPFHGNSAKYRAEFSPSIFQSIVELLTDRVPNDLLKQSLWYGSNNSHAFWLKTQSFIRSCAVMSMVGYVIGLGDRHPENILIDMGTGEVIHIDYNICFELGKTLVVPEQVPFRLSPNMIRAFGFAGLEGEFTCSSVKVLNVIRKHRSLLMHLLDPVNLSFMIGQEGKTSIDIKEATRASYYRTSSSTPFKCPIGTNGHNGSKAANEMDMCSQESDRMVSIAEDMTNILMLNNSPPHPKASQSVQLHPVKPTVEVTSLYSDIQQNIKTPTKILTETADNIYKRINEKLTGTDEGLRLNRKQDQMKHILNLVDGVEVKSEKFGEDLISLENSQSVEDQVACLIAEATSIKNKAAMFEGWMAWV